MHETRKKILEVLCSLGVATVEQIAEEMKQQTSRNISTVTIRYHLNILQQEGRVSEPRHLERSSRGRPQHVFTVTEEPAQSTAVKAYADTLLAVLNAGELTDERISLIGKSIASIAGDLSQLSIEERFTATVKFLNERGYKASWGWAEQGAILTTNHCPYHEISSQTPHLCQMDMGLITSLIGAEAQKLTYIAGGDEACSYWFDVDKAENATNKEDKD